LWNTAKPFLERWMDEQVGWRGLLERLKNEAPRYAQLLPELPRLVHRALLRRGDSDPAVLEALLAEQRRTNRMLRAMIYGGLGFVLGVLLMQLLVLWRR
jgi:ubiquinone biosynthesis protein